MADGQLVAVTYSVEVLMRVPDGKPSAWAMAFLHGLFKFDDDVTSSDIEEIVEIDTANIPAHCTHARPIRADHPHHRRNTANDETSF